MKTIRSTLLLITTTLAAAAASANVLLPDTSPVSDGQHVVINIPQQRLFLYKNGQLSKIYPVAVGKAMTQTNLGEHKIGAKAFNPVWHIPKSIQKERGDGVTTVPAGPNNPLGPVFVRLGDPKLGLGIHGTNAPSSVPGVRSHGCVRMKSPDALEFANTIATGSPASVIYQLAGLNEDSDKNLWLSAYRDPYSKANLDTAALKKSIQAWAKSHNKTIAASRIDAVLKARTGAPVCLSCTKKAKLKSPLKSLAWTSGSAAFSKPKAVVKPAPAENVVLPKGAEIEVDAGDTPKAAPAAKPKPTEAAAAKPAPKPAETTPSKQATQPASGDTTDLLF